MIVHKVTAFITRESKNGQQLLLFRHPNAGVQIPAGTVEEGESWQTAALREAHEETGLTQLTVQGYLGKINNELAPGEAVLTHDCQIFSQPDEQSLPFARRFTRGVTVKVGKVNGRFRQVFYVEYDQLPNPQAISLQIIGWLPQELISQVKTRHYVHLHSQEKTPDQWTLPGDNNHTFAPFWIDLVPKPAVVQPQNRWLDDVYDALIQPNAPLAKSKF